MDRSSEGITLRVASGQLKSDGAAVSLSAPNPTILAFGWVTENV
jgi:hypothetical protein